MRREITLEEAAAIIGINPHDLERGFEQSRRDNNFIEKNYAKLLTRYPDRFVAVFQGRVVGSSKNIRRLRKSLLRKGIDPGWCAVGFLPTTPRTWILAQAA